jgi:hypothetical protein
MKKQVLLSVIIFLILFGIYTPAKSQWTPVDLNFDGYVGTVASTPAGYYFSWHSTTSNSFYTSAGNFGVAPPSYKFGNDSDFIVTPFVISADSISFWSKGNGSPFSPLNELRIYHSADSVNWILETTLVPLSATATTMSVPLNQVSGYFKFEYSKAAAGGNLAFDDLKIYSNIINNVPVVKKEESISIYPSPTTGPLNIKLTNSAGPIVVEVFDMLGNHQSDIKSERKGKGLYAIDLSGKSKGFYFVKIQTPTQFVTKRITLTN